MDNSNRCNELVKLKSYTEEIDNELTMILQTLQWDRQHLLLQNPLMVTCRHDANHKVPPDRTEEHEKECFLRNNGYSKDDQLLPDPLDSESNTLVKLRKEDIEQIVSNASRSDISFKKGVGCRGAEPMSLERLQISYSADERRAIHDAVVSAVPSCHDLTDLMLPSAGEDKNTKVILSRKEILLELRNMRRRRTKYRVAAKSRNYSDVLRDVIRTQMEHFNEDKTSSTEAVDEENNRNETEYESRGSRHVSREGDRPKHDRDKKFVPRPIKIEVKTEREDSTEIIRDYSRQRSDRTHKYDIGSRESGSRDSDRQRHNDRSRERRSDYDLERDRKYGEYSRKRRLDDDFRDETRERRYYYEGSKEKEKDKDYRSDKRSRERHENGDYLDNQVEQVLGQDDNPDKSQKSKKRRLDGQKDKPYKDKERNYHDSRHKDRERSRERRPDHRHEERNSNRINIKQEREESITQDDRSECERDRGRKNYDRKYDKAYKDRNYDSHSSKMNKKKYSRYYDIPSEELYDPKKVIKQEK